MGFAATNVEALTIPDAGHWQATIAAVCAFIDANK
jgi:hypothetical protein